MPSCGQLTIRTSRTGMARKFDSCITPPINGERKLRNTPIRRRSDSARLRSPQSGRSFRIVPGASSWKAPVRAHSSLRHWMANSYCRHNQRGIGPRLDRSGSGTVIVVQHAAQALPALDLSRASEVAGFWTDELVSQSLMIALAVIMSNEVLNGCPQRLLAEEDHAIQAGLLDGAHKSLRVGVQIRRSRG